MTSTLHATNAGATATPAESCIYVTCVGQIESANFGGSSASADGLYCRYSYSYGKDWLIAGGVDSGISQVAVSSYLHNNTTSVSSSSTSNNCGTSNSTVVWNMPMDVTFKSTNIFGWPRLAIAVYGLDWLGRDVIKGYCSVVIPLQTGSHTITTTALYTPMATTLFNDWAGWLNGNPPEFYNAKFVCQSEGRDVTRVCSTGGGGATVTVKLHITTKGMKEMGYSV